MLYFILIFVQTTIFIDTSFLYKANRSSERVFDCFHVDTIDDFHRQEKPLLRTNYLVPYCRRLLPTDAVNEAEGYIENNHTFKSLRLQEIASEDLLKWSITIDVIEQYAVYLDTNDTEFDEFIFNNCSSFWFGSRCQYTFALNTSIESFNDLVSASLQNREKYKENLTIHACYSYMYGCYRGPDPMCLDWREICDGKIDCIGDHFGIDEEYCYELEINECHDDEYRCHNGAQCIPLEFFRDGHTSTDCLDGTDESRKPRRLNNFDNTDHSVCINSMRFACEERTCRSPRYFSCGDGICKDWYPNHNLVTYTLDSCKNTGRFASYSRAIHQYRQEYTPDCYKLLFCKLRFYSILTNDTYTEEDCLSEDWRTSFNCTEEYLSFPIQPIFSGYFQPVYSVKNLIQSFPGYVQPAYICNKPQVCSYLPKATTQMNGLDCRRFQANHLESLYLESDLSKAARVCALMGNINTYASNSSSLYYCEHSLRYISKHRLIDGVEDCHNEEDETYPNSCSLNDTQRFTCTSEHKCLSPVGIGFDPPDCRDEEDQTVESDQMSVYPRLCNGIPDFISEGQESDETNCQWWPCFTPYTRCDNYFQCLNGIDERNCPRVSCGSNEYKCDIVNSTDYYCISQEYVYELRLNCTEPQMNGRLCREIYYSDNLTVNINHDYVSWKNKTCLTEKDICNYSPVNDENSFCPNVETTHVYICSAVLFNPYKNGTTCTLTTGEFYLRNSYLFSTWNLGYSPTVINKSSLLAQQSGNISAKKPLVVNTPKELIEHCNRGLVIYEGKSYEPKCLCPPNYFGDRCQWQNQRVSLTLQLRALGPYGQKLTRFHVLIYLINDEDEIIHDYAHISYIPSIDCNTKYNRYLLYPTQPKDTNSTYSIRIDAYDSITRNHYASWHLAIPFPFLPVNRLSTQIRMPSTRSQSPDNCSIDCGIHGKCYDYINSIGSFCLCDSGYSGRFCNLTYSCSCSLDSLCLNASICFCPLDKFGPRCYLQHTLCQRNPCKNNGRCMPDYHSENKQGFVCLCIDGYTGTYCEHQSTSIALTFKVDLIPSFVFVHTITSFDQKTHERMTTFQKIPFDQDSTVVYIKQAFHLLFIEFSSNYYLILTREEHIPSEHVTVDLTANHQCINIMDLLNSTIMNYTNLRRLKYYQLPCLSNPNLQCFYDEKHICICDRSRFSNCFEFNHTMSYDCQQSDYCENKGECFQDNATCPTMAQCMCKKCYYGSKCQLTTEGFSLSLDVIFGYRIKPFVPFFRQPIAVKVTAAVTMIMFILGLLNGLLSVLTFRRKIVLQMGSGVYLLINSVISLLTITVFTIKYWQLIAFHTNYITNRSLIHFSCKLTDVLLKTLLSSGDWLSACVAIERAFISIQGIRFNKSASKRIPRYAVPLLLSLTGISYIHDLIFRELFDDNDEDRIWCTVKYSPGVKVFNRFINIFHFLTPFIINCLSAAIIIIQMFRIRRQVETKYSLTTLLYVQIQEHKHLLISSCILIVLNIPRLVISFLTGCMESARKPWLFLIGYYISFVPPLLILVIFVLPSEKYKQEFRVIVRKLLAFNRRDVTT
ncbi:unnamed protein product [Adineta ricciae]|uniref:Uncharacterized protein n=1 Tax=Adineta ricciae TaxID=249248 RepID=A0A813V477_ADIRI|nr:unnamed protein product [Adineta ricciae]CAF0977694.1 unnamed protein product [Adineta ricciae]